MPEPTTFERAARVIAKYKKIPVASITPESTLQSLGVDSLDGLNIVFELEEEFTINIPDEQARTMKDLGEVVSGIDALLAEGEASPTTAAGA